MSDLSVSQERGTTADLTGQVALVTGGGRGLGRAFALALAQAGAAVAVSARSEHELQETVQTIQDGGGQGLAVPADVTDARAVERMVAETERRLGPVDLLVNNAGVLRALGVMSDVDQDAWWREVEINLRGPFLCARAVLPSMIARRRGRIINLASVGGLKPIETASALAVSKAALIRLSENLALENQAHGIAVFAIHPGTVRTPMTDYIVAAEEIGEWAPGVQQGLRQRFAEGRDTPLELSVKLVLYLASGAADTLSGRYIAVTDDVERLVLNAETIQRDDLYTLRLQRLDGPVAG
jgi:NAD(P)-dependent dehydrogenase (short-subunit alcohol dehydrogenase family)